MEVDVIEDVFRNISENRMRDAIRDVCNTEYALWNTDIYTGGCSLLWSPDNYTKACSRLVERCRIIDEKLRAPVTADILACLTFETQPDGRHADRAGRCLQFSTGLSISVENLFPRDDTPELLGESRDDINPADSEIFYPDNENFCDRSYQKYGTLPILKSTRQCSNLLNSELECFSTNDYSNQARRMLPPKVCIENPDHVDEYKFFSNPFDPNLSFNGFKDVFSHIPHDVSLTPNMCVSSPNFLLAFDNSTELFNDYLREYSDYVRHLSTDVYSRKMPNEHDPMIEVERIVNSAGSDSEITRLWNNIRNARHLWSSVQEPDPIVGHSVLEIETQTTYLVDNYGKENSSHTSNVNETNGTSDFSTCEKTSFSHHPQVDTNRPTTYTDVVNSQNSDGHDGHDDLDSSSDDVTSLEDIVKRVSQKYADRNYSEQDIHQLLISVLKSKKLEEGRQLRGGRNTLDSDGVPGMNNFRESSLRIPKEDKNLKGPQSTNKGIDQRENVNNVTPHTYPPNAYITPKNRGEPIQNFPHSSSMFWENNDVAKKEHPKSGESQTTQENQILLKPGAHLSEVNHMDQMLHHVPRIPYHHHHQQQQQQQHHVLGPQLHPHVMFQPYHQAFPPLTLPTNIHSGHVLHQHIIPSSKHKGQLPQQNTKGGPFQQTQHSFTKVKKQHKHDVVKDETMHRLKDLRPVVHQPSLSNITSSAPTFVAGAIPRNETGNTEQIGYRQEYTCSYNILPRPAYVVPQFPVPHYPHVNPNVQLVPHDSRERAAVDTKLVHPNDPNYRLDDEIWYINGVPHRHARPVCNLHSSIPLYPHSQTTVPEVQNGGINRRIAEQVAKINKSYNEHGGDKDQMGIAEGEDDVRNISANNNIDGRNILPKVILQNPDRGGEVNRQTTPDELTDSNNNNICDNFNDQHDFFIPDEEITCFDDIAGDFRLDYFDTSDTNSSPSSDGDLAGHVIPVLGNHANYLHPDVSKNNFNVTWVDERNESESQARGNISVDRVSNQSSLCPDEDYVQNGVRQIKVLGRNRHKKERVVKKKPERTQRTLVTII